MKYMTKEWYETAQKTDLHLLLKVSRKAEQFSEDYFQRLYQKEEANWLTMQRQVSELSFDEAFPEDFQLDFLDEHNPEGMEIEQLKAEYVHSRETLRQQFEEISSFDPEEEKETFRQGYLYARANLQAVLPGEILKEVADIRVLALDHASAKVKGAIKSWCLANEKAVKSAVQAYQKDFKRSFAGRLPDFIEQFNFHDCVVVSCRKKGKDLVIELDLSGGFTDISGLILKDCQVIKRDRPLHGAWWLYEEIYRSEEGYELHVLLDKDELIEFTVAFKDMQYEGAD